MTTEAGTTRNNGAAVEVRGAWQGQEPGRTFVGVVLSSEVPELGAGQSVMVAYQVAPGRTPGAGEHGASTLTGADGRRWPLMRLTCHDTAEVTWQAQTLPD